MFDLGGIARLLFEPQSRSMPWKPDQSPTDEFLVVSCTYGCPFWTAFGPRFRERMDGDAFAQTGLAGGIVAGLLRGGWSDMGIDPPAGKQPFDGAGGPIPGAQDLQQTRGQQGIAIPWPLLFSTRSSMRWRQKHLSCVDHNESGYWRD